jgi:hypothetical protein
VTNNKTLFENLKDNLKDRVHEVKQRVEATAQRVAEARTSPIIVQGPAGRGTGLTETERGSVPATHEEPPVVARMIIEIRSDGARTVARGALEDVVTGERVSIDANGGSPMQLAASLASSLLATPFSLGKVASAMVRNRLKR